IPASAGSPIRWCNRSSLAGRRHCPPPAPAPLASPPTPASTRSSRPLSKMTSKCKRHSSRGRGMRIDRLIERVLFASRWLLAPIYLGLSGMLLIFAIRFLRELVHLAVEVPTISEVEVILGALSLIDLALVAGLIVMI